MSRRAREQPWRRVRNRVLGAAALLIAAASAIQAQSQSNAATLPQFEVASLKPGQPLPPRQNFNINLGTVSHGTLTLTNTSLADCLKYAYGLSNSDQLSGPDWIKSKVVRFDIVAKAPPDTPLNQLRLMLQSLLTERFQLAFHRDHKELSYLALTIGKKGPKLQEAIPDSDASGNKFVSGRIFSNHISTLTLATLLSRFTGQTVVDMTGIQGTYDLKLEWAPENNSPGPGAADASDEPSLFAAVERQLGLKLEVRKGPVEVIVIDHAEKVPSGN